MSRFETTLLSLALFAWIGLGLAHVGIVMIGPEGWRPDRSAPGAAAVIGHPHDTDPRTVAGPLALVRAAGAPAEVELRLLMTEATDSADLLYTRYQLAHLLYPRRVQVRRAVPGLEATQDSALLVLSDGVRVPDGCSVVARSLGSLLLRCGET